MEEITHTQAYHRMIDGTFPVIVHGHGYSGIWHDSLESAVIERTKEYVDNGFIPRIYENKIAHIGTRLLTDRCECSYCGEQMILFLGEEAIHLMGYKEAKDRGLFNREDIDLSDLNNMPTCPAAKVIESNHFSGEIKCESGIFLFADYFRGSERIDKIHRDDRMSIESFAGMEHETRRWESYNVAYGQLTNTHVSVIINKDKTEILIGDFTDYESGDDIAPDGFEVVGGICCDMWRWMCGDKETMKDLGYTYDPDGDLSAYEPSEVEVSKGTWHFEHYYTHNDRNNTLNDDRGVDPIYARLTLKKAL